LNEEENIKLDKIKYEDLNARTKEMYNFQKVSAKLADYGFTTMRLNNDWQGQTLSRYMLMELQT